MVDIYDRLKAEDLRQRELQDNVKFDKYPLATYNFIGQTGVTRVDGYEKASGYAEYTMDVQLPGMLYARFLTSPYANATITSMDTSKAAALPGVRAILRYDDPNVKSGPTLNVGARTGASGSGMNPVGYVLSPNAHFEGEPMAVCVAADTEEIAEDAIKLIGLQWDVKPFATEPGAALALATNVNTDWNNGKNTPVNDTGTSADFTPQGDVTAGFAASDKVIEYTHEQRFSIGFGPERQCGVFRWNGPYAEIWEKGQRPQWAKQIIANYFDIPMDKVETHCVYQGGSFGGWTQMSWQHGPLIIAGILAQRTGLPVKFVFTRREEFYYGSIDCNATYSHKLGVNNDGTITTIQQSVLMSYPSIAAGQHLLQSTKIPNVSSSTHTAECNVPVPTATRCEQDANCNAMALVTAHAAAALGMDPCDVAILNDGAYGKDINWLTQQKTSLGFPTTDSLKACIAAGKQSMNWDALWHLPGTKTLANGRMHGLGMYYTREWDDSGGYGNAGIRLEELDGSASILSMRCDCGTNQETPLCQIVADELGFDIKNVQFRPFKDVGFRTWSPDTSTNTSVNGFIVRNAARLLKIKILDRATQPFITTWKTYYTAPFPGKTPEELDIKNSVVFEIANPSNSMTMKALAAMISGSPEPMFAYGFQTQQGTYQEVRLHFVRQAHFMEVEVDTETGKVFATNAASCNDVGHAISPEGVKDQGYGGLTMGTSRSLTEECIWDPQTGVMLNGNGYDYKLLSLLDCPPITANVIETGEGYGPYGVCGIGENNGSIEVMTALAVYNAIGQWVGCPTTPEKVLKALGKA